MKNLRTCTLTAQDRQNFDPAAFTAKLKAAGFLFDSETCPVKIKKPWHASEDAATGSVIYRQWEE